MKLTKLLSDDLIKEHNNIIALTGGGGKTTLLKSFSSYLRDQGYSVLITTSTKVQNPLFYDYEADHVYYSEKDVLSHDVKKGEKVFYAEKGMDIKKVISPRLEVLSVLSKRYDVLLYEADGSRGLPVKIHSERDPLIIDNTSAVIAIMGLSAIFEKAYSVVFGTDSEKTVDRAYIQSYIDSPDGLFKGMEEKHRKIVVLNQADTGFDKIEEVKKVKFPVKAYIASEAEDEVYFII